MPAAWHSTDGVKARARIRGRQCRFDLASWQRCATTGSRPSSSLIGADREKSARLQGRQLGQGPLSSDINSRGITGQSAILPKCAPRASRRHGPCAELRLLSSILASQLLHTLTAESGIERASVGDIGRGQQLRHKRKESCYIVPAIRSTAYDHTGPGRRAQEGTGQVGGGRACEVGNSIWLVTAERFQDVSVLATRKPMASIATANQPREAARR